MVPFSGDGEAGPGGGGGAAAGPLTGVIAALPGELGVLGAGRKRAASRLGTPIYETRLDAGGRVVAVVSGVGKVAAASAAALLIAEGAARILVVGTCGGLRATEGLGDLVHARKAIQWDLAVRRGRELTADPELSDAWRAVAGGLQGTILTADRPVLRFAERFRLARAVSRSHPGPAVADMEAAAVGAVASQAGIPWAALKVVSDRRPGWLQAFAGAQSTLAGFEEALRAHGGKPADSVPQLCAALAVGLEAGPSPARPNQHEFEL